MSAPAATSRDRSQSVTVASNAGQVAAGSGMGRLGGRKTGGHALRQREHEFRFTEPIWVVSNGRGPCAQPRPGRAGGGSMTPRTTTLLISFMAKLARRPGPDLLSNAGSHDHLVSPHGGYGCESLEARHLLCCWENLFPHGLCRATPRKSVSRVGELHRLASVLRVDWPFLASKCCTDPTRPTTNSIPLDSDPKPTPRRPPRAIASAMASDNSPPNSDK